MKKLLIFIAILVPFVSSAQKSKKLGKKLKYLLEIFPESDKDFQITDAPAEFKDDPVVVLCHKSYLTFHNNRNNMMENVKKGAVRRRVLIQDKSALEYYSEYYYEKSNHTSITITKADGKKEVIDFENAVEVSTEVPKHYRKNYSSGSYYKIAIPNLEVGDIVDSYEIINSKEYTSTFSNIFTITEEFPIVLQEFIYDINGRWDFYINTFNGAPEVQKDQTGLSTKGKEDDNVLRYIITDKNRKASKYERWDYPYLSEPTIKYMVTSDNAPFGFDRPYSRQALDFESDISVYLKSFEEYMKTLNGVFRTSSELKKLPADEKVTQIYNKVKYYLLYQMLDDAQKKELKNGNVFPYSQSHYQFRSDIFSLFFATYLNKYKVQNDIVVIVPKQFGFTEDAVSSQELVYGVYVPATDRYYWVPDNYTMAGDISSTAFGATGYKIKSKNLKFKDVQLVSIELPESKPEENGIFSTLDVTFGEDNSLEIDLTAQYTGYFKEVYNRLLLYNTAYAYDDLYELRNKKERKKMEVFNQKKKFKKSDWRAKRYAKKLEEKADELAEYEETKFEIVKSWIENDYKATEINTFEVNSFGNESLTSPLQCASNFTSDEYLKKAGPNLIFDIGMLITEQVQLEQEEIDERTKPIEMISAKTITNTITITIPEGMKVEGLESLNYNVDNEAASFVSAAALEGSTIKINTKKIYKQEFLELTNWPNLVEMLEAAYQFTQQKVVLKKK